VDCAEVHGIVHCYSGNGERSNRAVTLIKQQLISGLVLVLKEEAFESENSTDKFGESFPKLCSIIKTTPLIFFPPS
jgi:hypothetical protein